MPEVNQGNRRIKENQKYGNTLYYHQTVLELFTVIGATLWPVHRVITQVVLRTAWTQHLFHPTIWNK